jgi:hypothetical protein
VKRVAIVRRELTSVLIELIFRRQVFLIIHIKVVRLIVTLKALPLNVAGKLFREEKLANLFVEGLNGFDSESSSNGARVGDLATIRVNARYFIDLTSLDIGGNVSTSRNVVNERRVLGFAFACHVDFPF